MNDLYIDFTENYQASSRKKLVFFGFGFLLISVSSIVFMTGFNEALTFRTMVSPACNFILGISFLFRSKKPNFFQSPCFIRINEDFLEYKFWRFQKLVRIEWANVKSIQLKPSRIVFLLQDDKTASVNLSYISMAGANKIKPVVRDLAFKKNVQIA
jgi:hypothetical protein